MQQKAVGLELFTEIVRCVDIIGEPEMTRRIRLMTVSSDTERKASDTIVEVICKQMPINRHALLSGESRGNRGTALMFLYVLHRAYLGYDIDQMRQLFKKNYETIRQRIRAFERLDDKHPVDMKTLKKFNEINGIIKEKLAA